MRLFYALFVLINTLIFSVSTSAHGKVQTILFEGRVGGDAFLWGVKGGDPCNTSITYDDGLPSEATDADGGSFDLKNSFYDLTWKMG